MYKVTVDGVFAGYSDTAVFVRLHENGCYIPCEETEAEAVVDILLGGSGE